MTETITIEKKVYETVLSNNIKYLEENSRLHEALETILDATQKDEPCVMAIRAVAYLALKGVKND